MKQYLTKREREVYEWVATTDLSYEEIAKRLFICKTTLKTHINNIYSKLGISTASRSEIVRYYYSSSDNSKLSKGNQAKETLNKDETELFRILSQLGIDFRKNIADERKKAVYYCYILDKFFNIGINADFTLYSDICSANIDKMLDKFYSIKDVGKPDIRKYSKKILDKIKSIFQKDGRSSTSVSKLRFYVLYDFYKTNFPTFTEEEIIKKVSSKE